MATGVTPAVGIACKRRAPIIVSRRSSPSLHGTSHRRLPMIDLPSQPTYALQHNRRRYERLVAVANWYAVRGRYDSAVAWSVMAADQAWNSHPGLFVDNRLEQLLAQVGATLPSVMPFHTRDREGWPKRVFSR